MSAYDTSTLIAQLRAAPGLDRLAALIGDEALVDTAGTILEEAARFAAEVLAPLNPVGDKEGNRWDNGVVTTAPGFRDAFRAFLDAGWHAMPLRSWIIWA